VTSFSGAAAFYLNVISEENALENAVSAIATSKSNSIWSASPASGYSSQFSSSVKNTTYSAFCYNCWYYLTVQINSTNLTQYKIQFSQVSNNGTTVPLLANNKQVSYSSTSSGTRNWTKFIVDSKEAFVISLVVASGTVNLRVMLDPTNQTSTVWSLTGVTGSTQYINVTAGDSSLHLGATYFISMQQTNSGSASYAVKFSQNRRVQLLPNGIS
jgi:hypothetical protein